MVAVIFAPHVMTLQDLLGFYDHDARTGQVSDALENAGAKVEARGLVGSARSFLAAQVIRRHGGDHLFLLEDKERAAYFMNDLENLLGDEGHQVLFYPRSARVPYQEQGTDNANVAMRAEVMSKVSALRGKVCIVSFPEAVAEQVTTRKELKRNTYTIKRGDRISQDFLDDILIDYGFEKVEYVYEPGQYAIRGGIVDIFSFAFDHPYRIELFGDEVDGIRKFDPSDQLSVGKMDRAVIVPDVGDQLLKEEREPFLEFLGEDCMAWTWDVRGVVDQLDKEVEKAQAFYDRRTGQTEALRPGELYTTGLRFERGLERLRVVEFGGGSSFTDRLSVDFGHKDQPGFNKNFDLLAEHLKHRHEDGYATFVVAGQGTQLERLHDIFADRGDEVKYQPIPRGTQRGLCRCGTQTCHLHRPPDFRALPPVQAQGRLQEEQAGPDNQGAHELGAWRLCGAH